MHDSVRQYVAERQHLLTAPVLDVGSYDVNGHVRDLCPTPYIGCDIVAGPNVDVVYDGRTLPAEDGSKATVVCLEVFEHCADPCRLAAEIVRVLKPGGTALITARGCGFDYHHPPDRWRFMPGALAELFSDFGCVAVEQADPQSPGWFVEVTK